LNAGPNRLTIVLMTEEYLPVPGLPPVTRSALADALRAAGVLPGNVLMVHTQMSAIGWVVGGADTVVLALQDALGDDGTLLVYTCWEHDAFHIADWPDDRRAAYRAEPPVFDPDNSEGWTGVGRVPERVRTWPGTRRSAHPLASVAALGPDADALTRDHRLDDGYGPTSPFARLVEKGGQILLLGAPLESLTIFHHAEALARVPEKRRVRFPARIRTPAGIIDVEVDEIDTSRGPFPYETILPDGAVDFDVIGRDALAAGVGRAVQIASARSHLFEAEPLVTFAVDWLEARFAR
jgi:aminoglycoside 3-N-acetyltransferase